MISDNSQNHINIRQFALTQFKNTITAFWDNKTFSIYDTDKETIKSSLIEAVIRSCEENKLAKMYAEISYMVVAHEYPTNKFPNLVVNIFKFFLFFFQFFNTPKIKLAFFASYLYNFFINMNINYKFEYNNETTLN